LKQLVIFLFLYIFIVAIINRFFDACGLVCEKKNYWHDSEL
jgi:hypothetical protein